MTKIKREREAELQDDLVQVVQRDDGSVYFEKELPSGKKLRFDYDSPFILELELTWRCNLACFHCYVDASQESSCKELSLKEIEALLVDARELGIRELSLTGGEVLLRKDLPDVLHMGEKLGFGLRFVTNGSLFDQRWAKALEPYPIKLVTVSLDSSKGDVHNRLRGCDCHGDTIAGIERMLEQGYRVSIITAFSPENLADFRGLYEFCLERSLDWQVQMTSAKGRCPRSRVLNPREYYELGCSLAEVIASNPPINIVPMDDMATFSRYYPLSLLSSTWQGGCSGGKLNVFVRADGSVTPCSALSFPPFIVGNVREQSLSKICRAKLLAHCLDECLTTKNLEGVCARCPHKENCFGGCPEILCTMCQGSRENKYCYWAIEEEEIFGKLEGVW